MSKVATIKINDDISWRNIAKKMIVLNKKNNFRYVLNGLGQHIWNYIAKNKPLHAAIDEIAREYSVSRDKVAFDVDRFLQNLEKEKIISIMITS